VTRGIRPSQLSVKCLWATAMLLLVSAACTPRTDQVTSAGGSASSQSEPTSVAHLPSATFPSGPVITLELAVTPEEIANGLMFRPSLRDDRGMLFLFQVERVPSFWMKNTIIPLDLVFFDGAGTVVDIIEDAQPCAADPCPQYIPDVPARTVLEIPAGIVGRHGLIVGDVVAFDRVEGYPIQSMVQ
jgi:uncharacterized membrane protein (UPF0127 family)